MATFRLPTSRKPSPVSPNLSSFEGLQAFLNQDDQNKEDYLISGAQIEFTNRKTLAIPTKKGTEEFAFSPWSFDQFSDSLKIPPRFLADCPITGKGSMKDLIEMRMEAKKSAEYLIRTRRAETDDGVSGVVRAVLNGNYSPFDNRHLLAAVKRAVSDIGGKFNIISTNANDPKSIETAFHLRMTENQKFDFDELGLSDPHHMGFHARTSEVGAMKLRIDALVYRLVCANGMMGWADSSVLAENHKGLHVHEMTPRVHEAVLSSVRQKDAVKEMLSCVYTEVVQEPETQLLLMGKHMRMSDMIIEEALNVFRTTKHDEVTRFHLAQAFTQASQALPIAERAKIEESVGEALFTNRRRRAHHHADSSQA
jgi:hypothetical protein